MFLPRGAVIADELEKLAKETEFATGYQRVRTPHIAREALYKKSGHLPYYADSMFPPMRLRLEGERQATLNQARTDINATIQKFTKEFTSLFPQAEKEKTATEFAKRVQEA